MGRRREVVYTAIIALTCLGVLVLAGTAIAQDDAQTNGNVSMPVGPADHDSTERLVLADPVDQELQGEVNLDPTVATSTSFAHLKGEYNRIGLEAAMEEADGSQEEVAVVNTELERLEDQISEEIELQRQAYEGLAAGDYTGDEFLRELSMIQLRSHVIEQELDTLSDALRGVTAPVTRDDAQRLRGEVSQSQLEVQTLRGPVTDSSAAVVTGEDSSLPPVAIRASGNGYVLATVHDGVFLREAVATENRIRGSGAGFADIEGAREITAALYPWTVGESLESEDVPRGEIFASRIDHPHGTTSIYIDGETERPFRDGHELDLFSIPMVESSERAFGDAMVRVERTYGGGPTAVHVSDTVSGDPISEADLYVGNRSIGSTDAEGSHWFVAPDDSFELRVELENETVTVWIQIPGEQ